MTDTLVQIHTYCGEWAITHELTSQRSDDLATRYRTGSSNWFCMWKKEVELIAREAFVVSHDT